MEIIVKAVIGYLVIVFGSSILGFMPVWLLWNWLCPTIFGLPEIDIIQSFGLVLLISCLFGALSSWGD
jgi:hypothetical protein